MNRYRIPTARQAVLLGACAAQLMLAGCAGDNARTVAFNTLQTTVLYEKKLDAKIAAEQAFYRTQLTTLRESLAGAPIDRKCLPDGAGPTGGSAPAGGLAAKPADERDCFGNPDFKSSWLYGRIFTAAQRDARTTAGRLLSSDDGAVIAEIIDFAGRGIDVQRAALREVADQQRALTDQVAGSLKPLQKQKARLATIRKGLTTLSATPDTGLDLGQVQTIAEKIVEQIKAASAAQ
ncbi:hypothetical protein GCM10017083_25570 [Thalassobaculum fulvum]|uniref:Uncharacterized protein n=1 Tax=Thalassobaculum fulvum TaxID=1633335 RepID=A0A918XS10_9PROT|nr:hypothetical protein [Thalassobaculum fulvum]GHD51302.1 hypothetical protein GCM10017083_25570 [Thalassobaculum fulvum]